MPEFFRFPHTPHLLWLGEGQPRDDKVLSNHEVKRLLQGEVVIEEKLDGANLGFSLDKNGQLQVQNRGHYLPQPYAGQFSRLNGWLCQHNEALREYLTPDLILFGEWCAARHSLDYETLPDWFLLFDLYDRKVRKFWSAERRNQLADKLELAVVPLLKRSVLNRSQLIHLLEDTKSQCRAGKVEGVVVRRDSLLWNESRAKLVNKEFVQAIDDHWRSRVMEWNLVKTTSTWL